MPRPQKTLYYLSVVATLFGLTFTTAYLLMQRGKRAASPEEFLVAKVQGEPITKLQFQATLNRMLLAKMSNDGVVRGTDTFDLRLQAFDSLVKDLVMKQWAIDEKLLGERDADARIQRLAIEKVDRLQRRIERVYNTDNPDAYLEEFIKRSGFPNVQAFIEDTKMVLLEQELAKKLFPDEPVPRGEVLNNLPVARVRQIYRTYTAETRDLVRRNMEDLHAQLMDTEPGSRTRRDVFMDLAYKYSEDDASRLKGGDLGFLREADIGDPVMLEQLRRLDQGQISEVFTTGTGYHILYVEMRPQWNEDAKGYKRILDSAEDLLRLQKQKRKFLARFQSRLTDLVERGQLVVLDPLLDAQNEDRKGNTDKALELYEEALRLDPKNGYVNLAMAEIYMRRNDFQKAFENYQTAIDKNPEDPYLYVRRAKYYLTRGMLDEAAVDLSVASNSAPMDFELHAFLERVYKNLTMLPEAERERKRYFEAVQTIFGGMETYRNVQKAQEALMSAMEEDQPFMQTWLEEEQEQ